MPENGPQMLRASSPDLFFFVVAMLEFSSRRGDRPDLALLLTPKLALPAGCADRLHARVTL
eukprot:8162802-Pyramimonas_sp.AAC.1